MTWTAPVDDLRTLLSDGPKDRLHYRKRVLGEVNGTNTSFKTFEFRRVTDFTTDNTPLGIWVDGVLQAPITTDFIETGDFSLDAAPAQGSVVEASYYSQWFNDTELASFLKTSCNWLAMGDDYTMLEQGLRPAALKYSAAEAYQKLALRWAEKMSEVYLLNDAPEDKRMSIVEAYRKQSLDMRKEAETVRNDFYSRAGRQFQPLFQSISGSVPDNVPKR